MERVVVLCGRLPGDDRRNERRRVREERKEEGRDGGRKEAFNEARAAAALGKPLIATLAHMPQSADTMLRADRTKRTGIVEIHRRHAEQ